MSEAELHAAAHANSLVVLLSLVAGAFVVAFSREALGTTEGAMAGLAAALGVAMIGSFVASRRSQVC